MRASSSNWAGYSTHDNPFNALLGGKAGIHSHRTFVQVGIDHQLGVTSR